MGTRAQEPVHPRGPINPVQTKSNIRECNPKRQDARMANVRAVKIGLTFVEDFSGARMNPLRFPGLYFHQACRKGS